jgi:hypothetical protein
MVNGRVYIALDQSPEHAAALGRLLGHWAVLEHMLTGLMQCLLGTDPKKTDLIYKEIVSTKAKFLILKRMNHHFTIDKLLKKEIDVLLTNGEKLNKQRNSFIHASWIGDSNNLYRDENILEGNYKKMHKPSLKFTPDDIQNVVEDIAKLSASFGNLLFRLLKAQSE